MDKWQTLTTQFWQAEEWSDRLTATHALVEEDPVRAEALLKKALTSGRIRCAAWGLAQLQSKDSIPLLLQAFSRGGRPLELRAILDALARLQAIDALCDIAEDPYTPLDLRLEALDALSHFPTERTIALFEQELSASSLRRQRFAVETLGNWRIARIVPILCKHLDQQRHTAMRGPLLLALAKIATDDALLAIQQLLQKLELPLLREYIKQLSQLPQPGLRSVLEACRALHDGQLSAEIDDALHTLNQNIQAKRQQELAPFQQQLEDALF